MLWLTRFTSLTVKRTRAAWALALILIAAVACDDRAATDPQHAATQRASTDINPSPIDDLWISPNRRVTSGETAIGYLSLVNPPAAGTQVLLAPAHPNAYVSLDTVLIWPGGNIASFLVHTVPSPYQLGVSIAALVGSQWYFGYGFTLLASTGGGSGPPPPPARTLSATPDTLRFGSQAPNTFSAPQVVTVRNTSISSTEIIQVWNFVASGPFTVTDNHCHQVNLTPNGSCTVSVMYSPTTSAGAQTGLLTFQSGASTTPSVTLIGTPTPWIHVTPTAIGWGSVALGNATSGRVVKITNTGTATFSVSSLTLGGTNPGDFSIATDACTGASLSPGASCPAYVSFEPLRIGTRSATVTIVHSASGGPKVVSLSGTGVKPSGYIP